MTDWLPFINTLLNLLVIPILKVLWDIRSELARLNGRVDAHNQRLERVERIQDAQ